MNAFYLLKNFNKITRKMNDTVNEQRNLAALTAALGAEDKSKAYCQTKLFIDCKY